MITPEIEVAQWRQRVGLSNPEVPSVPSAEDAQVALDVVMEEADELTLAVTTGDLPQIAKEAADVLFSTISLMEAFGLPVSVVWTAVVASNMTKTGERNEAGKVLKGTRYQAPDMPAVLRRYGWNG